MNIVLNIALFIASGLFAVLFFSRTDFIILGDLSANRTTILYFLGGAILVIGAIIRIFTSELSGVSP